MTFLKKSYFSFLLLCLTLLHSYKHVTLSFSDIPNCLTWKACVLVNFIHVNMILGLTPYLFPFTPCWTCLASTCVSHSLGASLDSTY